MERLPKHERYAYAYKPGEVYWGLGIENETYIEMGNASLLAAFLRNHQRRERYSVDYWSLYKPTVVNTVIDSWIQQLPEKDSTIVKIPLLLNAHTLDKTDRYGQPNTTYEKIPRPNPLFQGKTLLEELQAINPDVFDKGKELWWTIDGDTIEFMTQQFYNAKMEDVIHELNQQKSVWLSALRSGLEALDREHALKGKPRFPLKNYGFAVYLTNRKNVGIFNNGTYHLNITLPTLLDKDSKIADVEKFRLQHQTAARMFQWISPLLVARYGSPDLFGNLGKGQQTRYFPTGSQRLCASRYVSVGTYDTETMKKGKLLLIENKKGEHAWYDTIYENPNSVYNRLQMIGVDINYQKHWNHGLELRIFDWFPEEELDPLFRLIIWMCDESCKAGVLPNPKSSKEWNSLLARVILDGVEVRLTKEEAVIFSKITNIDLRPDTTVLNAFTRLWETWRDRWNRSVHSCTSCMIRNPLPFPAASTQPWVQPPSPVTKSTVGIQTEEPPNVPLVQPACSWNCVCF